MMSDCIESYDSYIRSAKSIASSVHDSLVHGITGDVDDADKNLISHYQRAGYSDINYALRKDKPFHMFKNPSEVNRALDTLEDDVRNKAMSSGVYKTLSTTEYERDTVKFLRAVQNPELKKRIKETFYGLQKDALDRARQILKDDDADEILKSLQDDFTMLREKWLDDLLDREIPHHARRGHVDMLKVTSLPTLRGLFHMQLSGAIKTVKNNTNISDSYRAIERLSALCDKNKLQEPITVYRGMEISKKFAESFSSGEVFFDRGFMSTSLDPFKALQFASAENMSELQDSTNGYMVVCQLVSGTACLPLRSFDRYYDDENEILVKPNQKFKITDVDHKRHVIHMESVV